MGQALTSGPMFASIFVRLGRLRLSDSIRRAERSVASVGTGVTQCYRDRRFEIIAQQIHGPRTNGYQADTVEQGPTFRSSLNIGGDGASAPLPYTAGCPAC